MHNRFSLFLSNFCSHSIQYCEPFDIAKLPCLCIPYIECLAQLSIAGFAVVLHSGPIVARRNRRTGVARHNKSTSSDATATSTRAALPATSYQLPAAGCCEDQRLTRRVRFLCGRQTWVVCVSERYEEPAYVRNRVWCDGRPRNRVSERERMGEWVRGGQRLMRRCGAVWCGWTVLSDSLSAFYNGRRASISTISTSICDRWLIRFRGQIAGTFVACGESLI